MKSKIVFQVVIGFLAGLAMWCWLPREKLWPVFTGAVSLALAIKSWNGILNKRIELGDGLGLQTGESAVAWGILLLLVSLAVLVVDGLLLMKKI